MRSRALRSTLLSLQDRAEGEQGAKGVFNGCSGNELIKCIFEPSRSLFKRAAGCVFENRTEPSSVLTGSLCFSDLWILFSVMSGLSMAGCLEKLT